MSTKKSRLPKQETLSQSEETRAEDDGGEVSSEAKPGASLGLEADEVRSITMEIPGEAIVTPAKTEVEEPEAELAAANDGEGLESPTEGESETPSEDEAAVSSDPTTGQSEPATPEPLTFSAITPAPTADPATPTAGQAEADGATPASASAPPESDDEAFLRRVVLPAAPAPPARPTPVGATPEYPFFDAGSDDDRTVISDPPSPEILAAMTPPTAPAGSRLGARLETAPLAAFSARAGGRISLSVPQLGGVVAAALLVGGILGAALSGSDGEEARPISSARAEAQPVRRGLPEVVPLSRTERAADDLQPVKTDSPAGAVSSPAHPGEDRVPAEAVEAAPIRPRFSARRLEAIIQTAPHPTAEAPATEAPATEAPTREASTPEAPATEAPATETRRRPAVSSPGSAEADDRPAAASRPGRGKKPGKNWVDPFE